ncbi:retrovirus-related pol polyprotein from transposon TNT 1-94 [Tanacetum coccineum]
MTNTVVTTPVNITGTPVTNTVANHVKPPKEGQPSNAQAVQAVEAWKHSDFLCHNYVLNGLVDSLYNVYYKTMTAKELWESLECKYNTEDVGTKKFMKNTYTPDSAKANMVEHAESSSKGNSKGKGKGKAKNDKKNKGKADYLAPKAGIMPMRMTPRLANMVNDNVDMIAMVFVVVAMISEVNLVGSINSDWWVDIGATRYMCADKSMFQSFRVVDNGEKLYMGNSATADIKGEGDVILKMTSEKELKLTNSDKFVLLRIKCMLVRDMCDNHDLSRFDNQSIERDHLIGIGFMLDFVEFISFTFGDKEMISVIEALCAKHGIRHEFTAPYSPQQNGIAERKNRTLKEMVTAMLISSGMSQDMWGEAILTATYLLNKIPRKEKEETPYELWMEENLSLSITYECGLLARNSTKMNPRLTEAVTSSEGQQWREAIKSEIESILQNHTWELVDLPPGCKPLGYKWIFKKKMKADGTVDKYKARLVIQGNLEIHQMDVKTAFLNGDLEEQMYMNQPEGFIAPGQEGKDTTSGYVILCLYVDDMLIVGSNDKIIRSTKDMLKSKFDMKDMGLADVILGIKIIRTQNGLVPDLAYAVSRLSSRDYGLHYDRHPAVIKGYSDANWISDIKVPRSTSGYVFTLGGAAISWKSSKQTVIAKSTMESEFIALDKCGEEAEWLRQFVEDIPRWPKPVTAISIHCDSKSAMGRAKSTMYNGKSRHIRRRHNSIRQLLSTGVISIDYVASKDNIADPFTKGLSRELVSQIVLSSCTTALDVVPWETEGESVLRESCLKLELMTNTQTPPTVVNATGAPVANAVANHAEKPEKFNGQNFKRWQQKMFFYLTLGLARFLKETAPQVEPPAEGQSSNAQAVQAVEAWKHSDFLCHNYVLNGLIDPLYNVYCKTTTAKELWESLERKYKTEDAGTKKFVVARFLDYKMVDSKSVSSQHAGSIFQGLFIMGIREDKRKNDRRAKEVEYLAPKAGIVKQKFQGTCYNCDQPGHRAANCKMPKRVNPRQANMVDENVDMIAMVSDVCAMISEVNLVGTNNSGWWIDTGATRHVCADKSMFHSFRAVDNGQKLYMGNSATADIKGEGDVILKMTSEKELKLTNVLYVPEIRKNLVSGWLLNKFGFRLVFESDKFVLSKNQMYVGKGYAMNGMFKLNIMVVMNKINKINSSAYLIESSNVWHGRLEHYRYVYLLKSKDEAIDKFVLYKTEVKNQLGKKIKVVRSDRGGEYVSPFAELCAKHGIRHEFTAPYSPQQNGIAERKNRTLKEMVNAMLISSGLS